MAMGGIFDEVYLEGIISINKVENHGKDRIETNSMTKGRAIADR